MQFRGSGIYSMGYKTFKDGIEKKIKQAITN